MSQTSLSGSSYAVSQVWKIALRFSSPDKGIAVNSWNVPVKINNARAALCVSLRFPLLTLRFNPLRRCLYAQNSCGRTERGGKSEQCLPKAGRRQLRPWECHLKTPQQKHVFKVRLQESVRASHGSRWAHAFHHGTKKKGFGVLALYTALQAAICLSPFPFVHTQCQAAEVKIRFYQIIFCPPLWKLFDLIFEVSLIRMQTGFN